ncbi:MAG: PEP-CTERM/exosortase system-associated acyltransferase [Nitrosomonas sp.]|jgi:N-acyl amino acid synthase of PEP-CTERM/exosortase system|nr:PEP-CTERM/exosortase system-associated acyltransferase [Nitrosomonas sp.]
MMSELYDAYQKYFEIVLAETPELREIAYQIRYHVLCQEQRIPGFDQSSYPEKLEKDDFDDRAMHALLKHRSSGNYIGTIRIVLPDPSAPDKPFPVESYTHLDTEYLKNQNVSRLETAEISRALVIKEFQRRKGDMLYQETNEGESSDENKNSFKQKDRRVTANISLILMAAVVQMSVKSNAENWLSFINPALNRLLSHSGMEFTPIGPLVECHGIRRPYFAKMTDILNKTYNEYQDVWEILTDQGKFLPAKVYP